MRGAGRFRLPWRRERRTAAPAPLPSPVRRHVASVELGPRAVGRAREAVAAQLPAAGVAPGSAFADAVLLVVSELVANVLRHADRSPVMDVGLTASGGHLVVGVADAEPRLPDLSEEGMGAGLRMVTELAAEYHGEVSAEPAVDRSGKVVLVRFELPAERA
ncbi:ATP-binding protein [Streptomyces sp. RY43-2]|uniref:ATP-binding protein n=1 Tax=Streptomyces macrolidinus TaxID=2952607 RepID=A0ABT0ZIN4_9ACTN|nr:ATP-binding protein [Streptomyces macrolidinus]MCN9243405.1 ATP-binding protein [Streptomyces macrolidinus]